MFSTQTVVLVHVCHLQQIRPKNHVPFRSNGIRIKMGWLNDQIRNSLLAMLGSMVITTTLKEERIEKARQIMLAELDLLGETHRHAALVRRIRYATDAHALWFLRSELMVLLISQLGENLAAEKLAGINLHFKGLLPKALLSRSKLLKP